MSELAGGQAPTLKALIFSLSIGVARLCVPRHGTVLTQTWQINRHANERVHALAFVLPSLSLSLSFHNWTLINAPTCLFLSFHLSTTLFVPRTVHPLYLRYSIHLSHRFVYPSLSLDR